MRSAPRILGVAKRNKLSIARILLILLGLLELLSRAHAIGNMMPVGGHVGRGFFVILSLDGVGTWGSHTCIESCNLVSKKLTMMTGSRHNDVYLMQASEDE